MSNAIGIIFANSGYASLQPAFPRLCNEETLKMPVNIRV